MYALNVQHIIAFDSIVVKNWVKREMKPENTEKLAKI